MIPSAAGSASLRSKGSSPKGVSYTRSEGGAPILRLGAAVLLGGAKLAGVVASGSVKFAFCSACDLS